MAIDLLKLEPVKINKSLKGKSTLLYGAAGRNFRGHFNK